jgi:hypothetical protein
MIAFRVQGSRFSVLVPRGAIRERRPDERRTGNERGTPNVER